MNHTWRETTREKGGHSLPSTLRASGESAGNMERSAGTIEVSAQVGEATFKSLCRSSFFNSVWLDINYSVLTIGKLIKYTAVTLAITEQ